jgi:hypothetical protein
MPVLLAASVLFSNARSTAAVASVPSERLATSYSVWRHASTSFAFFYETFKLYLKDGGYHMVREYKRQGDRIRYFSTERGEWEEIPVELVDLEKTEGERKARTEAEANEARAVDEEEKAERALHKEIASIPMNPGAYYMRGKTVETLALSDYQVITDKKRKTLQILSPVPLVPGKAVVVIKGDRAKFTVGDERPEFYFRRDKQERFTIVKVTPKKNTRIVENISIAPIVKQASESRKEIPVFQQDLGNGLFKVWPEKTLDPGEYAMVQFGSDEDPSEIDLLVWDFAYVPSAH